MPLNYFRNKNGIFYLLDDSYIISQQAETIDELLTDLDLFFIRVKHHGYECLTHFSRGVSSYKDFIKSLERLYKYSKKNGENPDKNTYEVYLMKESYTKHGKELIPFFSPIAVKVSRGNDGGRWRLL